MKSIKVVSLIIFLFSIFINTAYAALGGDYNSSRSNKSNSIAAPDVTDTLIAEASRDAAVVAKSMIANAQQDGYTGDYEIAVDVRVSIQRAPKGNRKRNRNIR